MSRGDQIRVIPGARRKARRAAQKTLLLETGHGPRVVWGAKSPKVKKR
jgi:hypothetical protein